MAGLPFVVVVQTQTVEGKTNCWKNNFIRVKDGRTFEQILMEGNFLVSKIVFIDQGTELRSEKRKENCHSHT